MIKYNTIDIDINPLIILNGKEYMKKIFDFILHCDSCQIIKEPKDSDSKGYHLFFYCKKDCDICRWLFDDSKRYMMDFDRLEERKNVMFDAKHVTLNET